MPSLNGCIRTITYEWTWAYDKLEEFYGINPEKITAEDIIHIVEKWKRAVVGLDVWSMKMQRKNSPWPP